MWKKIEGYENEYEVSDDGQIRSLDHKIKHYRGTVKSWKGRVLNLETRNGYKRVTLCKNGKTKRFVVHRLVAAAFIGEVRPDNDINHIDFNRSNNNVSNLEICTRRENILHSLKNGNPRLGERNNKAKLKGEDVVKIRALAGSGYRINCIAKMFNISDTNCGDIVRRNTWKHIA